MPRYFLDSSALVKRYHRERGSTEVEGVFAVVGNRFLVSRLALVEVHSGFARLVREAVITKPDFDKLTARLEEDVASALLTVAAVSGPRLQAACSLLGTQGLRTAMRTLDAIYLATAEALHGRSRLAAFVAADKKLLAAATASGLPIIDVG
jgi:predicted nucleic acid-binding protein